MQVIGAGLPRTATTTQAIAFEIWNEPNLIFFSYPQINASRYTQVLSEAYRTIKQVRKVPVISAGLADVATGGGYSTSYQTYLQQMYAAGASAVSFTIGGV